MIEIIRKDGTPIMTVSQEQTVPYLTFPAFTRSGLVRHGFSTRLGGVSEAHLSSMNLGFGRGDDEAKVRENFCRIAAAIGFKPEDMVLSHQTHTTNVQVVTEADRGRGFTRPLDCSDIDGMITNVPGLVLTTFYADCVPLFFLDPVRRVIGLSHSGWRGTVGKIGAVTLAKMQQVYGTEPGDVIAAIGPSICMDCYEVSEDVIAEFKECFPEQYWSDLFYRKANHKYQLDLWAANRIILESAGVQPANISCTDICTCCNSELLYSHRASQGRRGNLAAFLTL